MGCTFSGFGGKKIQVCSDLKIKKIYTTLIKFNKFVSSF